jgi:hypothetical protein
MTNPELWQPFSVREQDEILDQLARTIPAPPRRPPTPRRLHAYTATSDAPAPATTGRPCACLTLEEHLSAACEARP